ncbi:hypothetical protein BDA96_01G504100 [Sorghum bicolor]|uniref:Uncharacterized protein n=2 Tax=Sorghum bicolor TaxID=4558 RepID=A0A921S8E1_SORBI|nr:hypothetical protein BDA96_01G504100 [Sorghum bicolor]KXG39977.1 hypothetical protein SORBI_3001G472900 [Sorghum bicolor]
MRKVALGEMKCFWHHFDGVLKLLESSFWTALLLCEFSKFSEMLQALVDPRRDKPQLMKSTSSYCCYRL